MTFKKILIVFGFISLSTAYSQCDYTHVTSFPFVETFCHDECSFVTNIYSISDTDFGCWTCLNNPHYYVITPTVDMVLYMEILPDLNSHLATNLEPQVAGFILFDGCPNFGGQTLFRPWTYSAGVCWSWDVLDEYCGFSQSVNAPNLNQGCVTETPSYAGMAHEVTMSFILLAGHEYWFCVFPQGGCPPWTSTCTWGCITVSFQELSFLNLSAPLLDLSAPPQELSTLPRFVKLHIPNRGIVIKDTHTGYMYNTLMQRLIDSE